MRQNEQCETGALPKSAGQTGVTKPRGARDPALDAARGLVMVLVVYGHSMIAPAAPEFTRFIFLFHVPAFFFISGYLMKPAVHLANSAHRILLPLFSVGLAVLIAKAALLGSPLLLGFLGLLWGTGATLPWSHLWFLPTLFLALTLSQALVVGVVWLTPRAPRAVRWATVLLVAIGLMAVSMAGLSAADPDVSALIAPRAKGPTGWPWSLDIVPTAVLFVLAGWGFSRIRLAAPAWMLLTFGAIILTVALAVGVRTDLNLRVFQPYGPALAAALAGSLCAVGFGSLIRFISPLRDLLALIGRQSMIVFLFHTVAQKAVIAAADRLGGDTIGLWGVGMLGLAGGIALPLILQHFIIRRAPPLQFLLGQRGA